MKKLRTHTRFGTLLAKRIMAKKRRLFFDSQQQASSMLQIPIEQIRQAKRDGCPAFRSGRVYIAEFRSWLKNKQRCGDTETDPNAEERAIRLRRDRLRLEREEFEFEQLKEKMVPISQVELLFSRTLPAFKAAVLALGPRINKRIEGLDYNGRMLVFDEEIRTMLKTLANATYLHPIEADDTEKLAQPDRDLCDLTAICPSH